MSKHIEFIPINDPKLIEELKHKQGSIDALLSLTKFIIGNKTTLDIFKLFVETLQEKFNYANVFFLYKTKPGWFVLHNNQHKHLTDLNLLEFLSPFTELTYLDENESVLGEFDTIVPVIYKNNPLAYLMVEGVHNKVVDSVEEELRFLEAYTNIVVIAAENQRLLKQEIQQEYEKKELKMAAEVQLSLIPNELPNIPGCSFAYDYIPQKEIGGDGFDVLYVKEENAIFLSMADVSGKGISAAMLMANFQAHLHNLFQSYHSDNSFAQKINKTVYNITKGDRFISLFVAKVYLNEKKIRYVNFGHNPPFFIENGNISRLDKGSTIIGAFAELPFIDIGEVTYKKQAQLFMFTDGIIDVTNENKEQFGMNRLHQLLENHKFTSAQEMNNTIRKAIDTFRGEKEFNDDMTCLATFLH